METAQGHHWDFLACPVLGLSLSLHTKNIESFFKATVFRKFENPMTYVSTNLLICAQVIPTLINPHDCSVYSKRRRYVLENRHFQPRSLERQWGLLEDKLHCKPESLNEEYKWMKKKKRHTGILFRINMYNLFMYWTTPLASFLFLKFSYDSFN